MTMGGRSLTARYADVYHVRDHKLAEHWHLAFDPKADVGCGGPAGDRSTLELMRDALDRALGA